MYRKGFTLIEIVIVVMILAILAGIAMPRYNKTTENARVAEAKNMLGAIREAQMRYAQENDAYAASLSTLDINVTAGRYFNFGLPGGCFTDTTDDIIGNATRNSYQCCGGYTAGYRINIYEGGNFTSSGGGPLM